MKTIDQKMAQAAWQSVQAVLKGHKFEEYKRFAMKFPALVHNCGLVQALAFAEIKEKDLGYTENLCSVLNAGGCFDGDKKKLLDATRDAHYTEYMRIARRAVEAATWIKRYVQANSEDGDE